MTDHFARPDGLATSRPRRLIAAGFIRRSSGRTLTVRATEAGVTGSIKASPTRAERLAVLHRQCDQDYASSAARRAQDHRDDAHLIAFGAPAVSAR